VANRLLHVQGLLASYGSSHGTNSQFWLKQMSWQKQSAAFER
jgi:hypothetical protein